MIYVVLKKTERILNRCDAWELDGDRRMLRWIDDNGYYVIDEVITRTGDMIIYVD